MTQADQRRWRQVRETWLSHRRGLCAALWRVVIRNGWSVTCHTRLLRQLSTHRPARAPLAEHWWRTDAPRRRVLDKLCAGQLGPRKVTP